MAPCKYPGCTVDLDARPYARKRDGVPSASTVAELLDDGKSRGFAWSASLIAATEAVHHPDNWAGLISEDCTHEKSGLCKACIYLRSQHDREWSAKANLGTHVHHMALSWASGEAVDEDETTGPYLDALAAFYEAHTPSWQHLERTILYSEPRSHMYRGSFDWVAKLDCPICGPGKRCTWLGDIKTGGYYPTSQTLQLAGYRYAQHLTDWTGGKETITGPMPKAAHAGVLLLGSGGGYHLVELPANGDAHSMFLRLVDLYRFGAEMKRWAREHPLEAMIADA